MCSSLYMASRGNHQAVACYQLPVLDEKCSWLSFLTWGTHRNLKSWGTVSASCTAHTVCQCWVMIKVCLDLWVHLLAPLSLKDSVSSPAPLKKRILCQGSNFWPLPDTWTRHKPLQSFIFSSWNVGRSHISFEVCPNLQSSFWGPGCGSRASLVRVCVCVCVCGAPLMTICVEQHQPHRHLGGSPKLRNFQGIIPAALLPNQPGTDMETESSSLSLLNKHSGSMELTQGDTTLDEEVGRGCQLEVSKKPEERFLFITKKCLGMRTRGER